MKGYRAQTLGVAAGAGGLVNALAQWAIGDLTLFSLIRALGDNWALIAGGLGLATLGAKLERQSAPAPELGETVSDIADRALRR